MEPFSIIHVPEISDEFLTSIIKKIKDGKAVIAVTSNELLIGLWYTAIKENGEIDRAYRIYRIAWPAKEKILKLLKEV